LRLPHRAFTLTGAQLPLVVGPAGLAATVAAGLGLADGTRTLAGTFPPHAGVQTPLRAAVSAGLFVTHRTDALVLAGPPGVAGARLGAAIATRLGGAVGALAFAHTNTEGAVIATRLRPAIAAGGGFERCTDTLIYAAAPNLTGAGARAAIATGF